MGKQKLSPLAKQWKTMGLISSKDRSEIDSQFNSTLRKTLNVIPGFSVSKVWKLEEVIDLEERCELVECIIDSLDVPLTSWGETLAS